jgi:biopolymer transport protein ExbD
MRKYLILLSGFLLLSRAITFADSSTQVVISADFAKTNKISVNGKNVSGDRVLAELSKAIKAQGNEAPIMVILPQSLTFTDWNNVRGLLDKVGFANVRYFVRWSATQKMIELTQIGPAVDSAR